MDKLGKKKIKLTIFMAACIMIMLIFVGCAGESTEDDKLKDIEFTVIGRTNSQIRSRRLLQKNLRSHFRLVIRLEKNFILL